MSVETENNQINQVETEDDQINWDAAFLHVFDVIFKFLNLKELCSAAQVNKLWNDAALREKAKRFYIEQLRLPYNFGNLASKINVNPHATLIIYDSKLERSLSLPVDSISNLYSNGLEEELMQDFKTQLRNEVIVFRVDDCCSTRDLQVQNRQAQNELGLSMLGLFFPSAKQRGDIQIASILHYQHYEPGQAAEYLAEELGLNNSKYSKSTLLLFFDIRDYFAPKIVSELHKRTQKGEELSWISLFGSKLAVGKYDQNHYWGSRHNIVAMRMSGPQVNSWTTFIRYSAPRYEIKYKLAELKEKMTAPERCCTGIVYSIKCLEAGCSHDLHPCADGQSIMQSLKHIFPKIPFVGMFENEDLSELPSVDDHFMKKIVLGQNYAWFRGSMLKTFTAVMIISYGDWTTDANFSE